MAKEGSPLRGPAYISKAPSTASARWPGQTEAASRDRAGVRGAPEGGGEKEGRAEGGAEEEGERVVRGLPVDVAQGVVVGHGGALEEKVVLAEGLPDGVREAFTVGVAEDEPLAVRDGSRLEEAEGEAVGVPEPPPAGRRVSRYGGGATAHVTRRTRLFIVSATMMPPLASMATPTG